MRRGGGLGRRGDDRGARRKGGGSGPSRRKGPPAPLKSFPAGVPRVPVHRTSSHHLLRGLHDSCHSEEPSYILPVNDWFMERMNTSTYLVTYPQVAYLAAERKNPWSAADNPCPLLEVGSGGSHPDPVWEFIHLGRRPTGKMTK